MTTLDLGEAFKVKVLDVVTERNREELRDVAALLEFLKSTIVLGDRDLVINELLALQFVLLRVFLFEEFALEVSDVLVDFLEHDADLVFLFRQVVDEYRVIEVFLLFIITCLGCATFLFCRSVVVGEFIVIEIGVNVELVVLARRLILLLLLFAHCLCIAHIFLTLLSWSRIRL